MNYRLTSLGCVIGLMFAGQATAHAEENDTEAITPSADEFRFEALPPTFARRVADDRAMLAKVGIGDPETRSKGLFNAFTVWMVDDVPVVKVCFFGGNQETRARIARIALEWKQAAPGVPLDFGDVKNPRLCKAGEVNHVRVGFHNPEAAGYWSLMGKASVVIADQGEQSLNLEEFDTNPPPPEIFRQTVLHEFGHALGLGHEHQHFASQCDSEFNWPEIYKNLKQPPNGWDKEQVDAQMRAINTPDYLGTEYDERSIMKYWFPPEYYKGGRRSTCYSPINFDLSEGDKNLMRSLYPDDIAGRRGVQQFMVEHWLKVTGQLQAPADTKSALNQLIGEYIPQGASENPVAEE
jgi:serralysin